MSKIILKNIGREKVNCTIEVENDGSKNEEDLANLAFAEVQKYLRSRNVWLEPDDEKGAGFWKVYVGLGYHTGDVEVMVA